MTETSKMLERVRALLAKAESTEFPAEAETFRAKADQLMTQYAIDQWMVDQANAGRNQRQEPIRRDFDRSWRGSKFSGYLRLIFGEVATHCRCVVGERGTDHTKGTTPVYGLPSDLDYLDALYTNILLEVAKSLSPPVEPSGEVGHEVFKQRQAGTGWAEILRKCYLAGLIEPTKANREKYNLPEGKVEWNTLRRVAKPDPIYRPGEMLTSWYSTGELGPLATELKNRLANANRRYVKEHGLQMDRNYVKPEVYQRSFMMGFEDEISARLREMRRRTYDAAHDANSMALAVRDIRQQAMVLYKQEFPPPPPVPATPDKNAKPSKALAPRMVRVDYGAMGAGRRKAREVNVSNNPGQRLGNKREIDR